MATTTKDVTHEPTGYVFTIAPLSPRLSKETHGEVRRLDGIETTVLMGADGSRQISADAIEAFNFRAATKIVKKLAVPDGGTLIAQSVKATAELIEESQELINWIVNQSQEFQKERESAFKADEKNS